MATPRPTYLLVPLSILSLVLTHAEFSQKCLGADAPPTAQEVLTPPASAKHFVITDYGAVADGVTLNTAAIQKAIDAANAAGGGVVEIPKGTFLSGSIFLEPGVELYLDQDAVLLGSDKIDDYPKLPTRIEGHTEPWRMALVNAQNMDHVRIGGLGQLNGNGQTYWDEFRSRMRQDRSTTNLDVERPRLVFIDHCADVRVEGISLQDSGFWNLHLYHCHDVNLVGLHIDGQRGPSTDGMDIDSSQNVTVQKCSITCGDDDIALKGSKGPHADQDTESPPVENILIEDCDFGSGGGVVTCGSEATIVRNVTVRNCTLNGTTNLLNLKLRPDTPQHYSNITVDGITATGCTNILNVAPWTQYFDLQGQPPPTSAIDHVTIRNVSGSFRTFGSLRGNTDNPQRGTRADTLSDITLENITVNLTNQRFLLGQVNNLVLTNVTVNGQPYQLPAPGAAPPQGAAVPAAPASSTAQPALSAPVVPVNNSPPNSNAPSAGAAPKS